MGMFDSIIWDYILPDEERIGLMYQTKDFYCTLATYKVDENGELYVRHQDYGDVDFPSTGYGEIKEEWSRAMVTSNINFYKFEDHKNWVEYKATIIDGKVVTVYKDKSSL